MRQSHVTALPDFPWDTLSSHKQRALAHPDGIVDLSVGTPVDPTPEVGRRALCAAADSHGYPPTIGTPDLKQAMAAYLGRRCGAVGLEPAATLPVLGTKESVAGLPLQLGLGPQSTVVIPEVAYPTYAVGARLAKSNLVACDDPAEVEDAELVWINSPANPTGAVAAVERLRAWVSWAREHQAILVSDECYLEFGWETDPISILHPSVCGDSHRGLLVAQSLSKRSNLAGYRAGFLAGDAELIAELTEVRKHWGFMMPAPVQHAMAALLGDTEHVVEQRARYARRRARLRPALERVGFRIEHSQAGLYLWATRDENGRDSVAYLAGLGILVAPGDFYGELGRNHIRVALTAPDERIEAAVRRLGEAS